MNTRFLQAPLLLSATLLVLAACTQAFEATAMKNGRYITESGNLEVDIAACEAAMCGKVVRVLANRSMSNPNATMNAADSQSPLGMHILSNLLPQGGGLWKGQIYNRENGKTYDCRVTQISPTQLKIRAYVGLPIFGKSQIWTLIVAGAPY